MDNTRKPEKHERASIREGRRESVRRILGAGALAGGAYAAGQWVKPVVEAVVLPAHAQTSTSISDPCSITMVCTGDFQADVTVTGVLAPPIPGVAVDLDFQASSSPSGPFPGSPAPFGSTVSDSNGQYSSTQSLNVAFARIRVIATLPDFPEAGEGTCELAAGDPGPHQDDSGFYFCQYFDD